ncbi:MAG: hypothetical protein GY810_27335 [Aureispira sp.]|nr:hypothetical protein [Aureispira sp.]
MGQTDSLSNTRDSLPPTPSSKPSSTKPISNWRSKQLISKTDTVELDSLPVFPSSIMLQKKDGSYLADSLYQVLSNRLVFKTPLKDSFNIRYRVFPYTINKPLQYKNRNMIGHAKEYDNIIGGVGSGYTYNPYTKGAESFNFGNLDYSGSFARGISVGNNQDLILNSSFNLQVAGKLGDFEILGAITDNNIPLQPEGNTQQLQDFDRIFVQLSLGKFKIIGGDYDLKRPEGSYFLNYFRRLQGGQVSQEIALKKAGKIKADFSGAVSKGKFARNIIIGQEGNQGPYRLKGNNGETFIIIIAGTERVFIDGKLLVRGADNDYIIDYNQGELTFTNKQLITKDTRIQLEFSYTDLNYLRTSFTFNTQYEHKRTRIRFNMYTEQDGKKEYLQGNLTDSAKAVLLRVGDDVDQAIVSGVSIPSEEGENTDLIMYKMVDTLVNGLIYDSVFVFSNVADSAIYRVKFSAITNGGNYIKLNNGTNGTSYAWVAPDPSTGKPQGTHEPVVLLITPQSKQLYTLGADYKIGKTGIISADLALSNYDRNTFSKVSNDDNLGIAGRLTYDHSITLKHKEIEQDSAPTKTRHTQLLLGGHYEYLQQTFEYIEPYRPREFQRDWNVNNLASTDEHLFKANLSLKANHWGHIGYEVSGLYKDTIYNGLKHSLSSNIKYKGLEIKSIASYLNTKTSSEKTIFIRPKADISYTFKQLKNWKIGAYGELENNRRLNSETDTLNANSFYYNLIKVYSELPFSDALRLKASWFRRYDYAPQLQKFSNNTIADQANFGGEWKAAKHSHLTWNFNYRNLRIQDTLLSTQDPKETYLGRLEYVLNLAKGFIRSNTVYELGAGQQQKIEYNYVKVDAGQGTHQWFDRNEDAVQQQNEFEQAQFQDQADFIRVTVLTGEFIRSNNVSFSQSLSLYPRTLVSEYKRKHPKKATPKFLTFLGKLSTRSIFKIERKTLAGSNVLAFNPFQLNVADSSLISISSNINNSLNFNRSGLYSFEFSQLDSRSKTLLSTGFDARQREEYTLRQRVNFNKTKKKSNFKFQLQLNASLGKQTNTSEFFPDRDYTLQVYYIQPQLTLLYKKFLRVIAKYKYHNKQNLIGAKEFAKSHDATVEITYNQLSKFNIRSSFSFVNLQFDGQANSAVGYVLTEGLQDGQNFLWNISFNYSISRNIQMMLSYEGRKTGDSKMVHVGRAQVRANF